MEEGFHVAGFGPADVSNGIVPALPLVGRVVPSRAIRPRDAQIEFFFVVKLALDIHPDRSDRDHDSAIPCNLTCEIDRSAAGSLGRDQHSIDPSSAGALKAKVAKVGCTGRDTVGSELCCKFRAIRGDVHAQDAAASRFQELDGELSEEPETDDSDEVTELHVSGTDTVKSDSAHGSERGLFETYIFRGEG